MALKRLRLDSFQAMKAVAFCVAWQQNGNSIRGVVESGYCGRRTAFNRLRCCRLAGFEPENLQYHVREADAWLAMEREWIRDMEREQAQLGFLGRLYQRIAEGGPYRDPLEVED